MGDKMSNKNILKNIVVITVIVSLFFTFSFLAGFSNSRTKTLKRISYENIFLGDDGVNSSIRGINIEDLISLVQEATSKHLTVLQEVLENAPGPAKKGIERAIEASVRGSLRAIEALSRIKNSNNGNEDKSQKTFHIISSCNRGGTIEPKGIQFNQGESVGFTIIPDEGYELVWVRVDNRKFKAVTSYSFDDVDSNHTIHAHFKKIKSSTNQTDNVD